MLSVVSLFTGAGGLDLGFEDAGFELRIGVENDGLLYCHGAEMFKEFMEKPEVQRELEQIQA